ncbi:MAG: PH domain-containing protein [Candidatus Thorarchaeota archaeon]|nr:MAG: PH domain-containing protein [Candidatus Thorarchaeota archaeon]
MSSDTPETPFPPEKKERLVVIFHPKRVSLIIFYVISVVMIITGVAFMSATAYGANPLSELAWNLGTSAIFLGIFLFTGTEMKRVFTLYIITTWNVRVRKGIVRKKTTRVFYDEISECRTAIYPQEKRIGMGDVEICSSRVKNGPTLVFEEVENPDGVREIISRFIQTIPYPLPWDHIERG